MFFQDQSIKLTTDKSIKTIHLKRMGASKAR